MVDAVVAVLVAVMVSFVLGFVLPMLLGRGLFSTFLVAFLTGKIIVVVHLNRGVTTYRLSSPVVGGEMVAFNLFGKKDIRLVSVLPGAVYRAARVSWLHVSESDTAPFLFNRLIPFKAMRDVPVYDEDGKIKKDKEGEFVTKKEEYVAYKAFEGFNDNHVIRNLLRWALIRPRRKIVGGLDIKQLLIGLVVVVIIVIVASQLFGAAPGAANTIG